MAEQETTAERVRRVVARLSPARVPTVVSEDRIVEDLGYDSLAMLEAAGQTQRRYAVTLVDDAVVEARTPREFLTLVNGELTRVG